MPTPSAGPFVAILFVLAAGIMSAGPGPETPADPGPGPDAPVRVSDRCRPWLRPVDAPVADPFREPAHRYAPGNRGIEYGVREDQPVRSAAPGTVTFVGPVAGQVWVVVEHESGDRSSYGPVRSPVVVRGQAVAVGAQLAGAAPGFHFTVRRGDTYVDPQARLDGACGHPRLVPADPASPVDQGTDQVTDQVTDQASDHTDETGRRDQPASVGWSPSVIVADP
ncbi:MAG: murein hydrolase activator EnvC family protein [Acidimicrobiales bacterium]